MTRIYLGRDEWWPVPDPRNPRPYMGPNDGYEIDQAIIDRYNAACDEWGTASRLIAQAAADAGDKYWQANT